MKQTRSRTSVGWLIGAAAGVCLSLTATVASGQTAPPTPPAPPGPADPWALLGSFPPGVDAAAVLDRPGERLFNDPSGRAVRAVLARTGMFSQTVRAWSGLAAALGYTEDEAAAALLGGRVIVAWEGLSAERGNAFATAARFDSRWAFVAEVERDTARAIRSRLKAAPRRTVAGRVVYTVDAGRIAMAVSDDAERTRVVIAPVEAAGLLDALLPTLRSSTTDTPSADQPVDDTARSASLATRARAVLGNVEPGWAAVGAFRVPGSDRPTAFELRAANGAWGARFATDAVRREGGAPVGVLGATGGDALFAAAFSGGPGLTDGTIDLRLRVNDEPASADRPASPEALAYDRGCVVVLHATDGERGAEPGENASKEAVLQVITHAATTSPFAERVDRLMSAIVGGEHPPAHRGLLPAAVRSHTMPNSGPAEGSDPGAAGMWPGASARVSWALAPDEADRSGVISIAIGSARVDPSGLSRKGREAWERGIGDFDPSMVTAGLARPAALAEMLGAKAGGPLLDLARSVDRVEWTVRNQQGLTRGEVLLRFSESTARLGAP